MPKLLKQLSLFSLLILIFHQSQAQITIENPNFGSKSHPTLTIEKIEKTNSNTKIYFRITNKSSEGDWFCVDKKVQLQEIPSGLKLKIISATGIPRCPETYEFTSVNESVPFVLSFPLLSPDTKYINIKEQCSNACFSFNGVIVDKQINETINEAYSAYSEGLNYKALTLFKQVVKQTENYPYGFIYLNIIKLYKDLNQTDEVKNWTKKLQESNINDKEFILKQINR